ncbi:hypothetical protein BDZ89DRAFT_1144171 [Hymenopellis radicata]|nr:hypothetical protein BDZ89DRAFT_1144171 [Hymenopellis radicata]
MEKQRRRPQEENKPNIRQGVPPLRLSGADVVVTLCVPLGAQSMLNRVKSRLAAERVPWAGNELTSSELSLHGDNWRAIGYIISDIAIVTWRQLASHRIYYLGYVAFKRNVLLCPAQTVSTYKKVDRLRKTNSESTHNRFIFRKGLTRIEACECVYLLFHRQKLLGRMIHTNVAEERCAGVELAIAVMSCVPTVDFVDLLHPVEEPTKDLYTRYDSSYVDSSTEMDVSNVDLSAEMQALQIVEEFGVQEPDDSFPDRGEFKLGGMDACLIDDEDCIIVNIENNIAPHPRIRPAPGIEECFLQRCGLGLRAGRLSHVLMRTIRVQAEQFFAGLYDGESDLKYAWQNDFEDPDVEIMRIEIIKRLYKAEIPLNTLGNLLGKVGHDSGSLWAIFQRDWPKGLDWFGEKDLDILMISETIRAPRLED